jgi:trans-aconitate 2-methyltransferase
MNKGSWDARTYDQVSRLVQYRWGKQVLELRKWRGNEIVLDAGCGSGLLTKQLAKKVPRGKVYAVDIDSNMIKQAKNNLQFFDNVEIMQSSFTDIKLSRKIDVIFSNSALHWVQDYRKTFQNFWKMLKPINFGNENTDISVSANSNNYTAGGGQLLIQCGGHGNLQQTITILEREHSKENLQCGHSKENVQYCLLQDHIRRPVYLVQLPSTVTNFSVSMMSLTNIHF